MREVGAVAVVAVVVLAPFAVLAWLGVDMREHPIRVLGLWLVWVFSWAVITGREVRRR